MSHLADPSSGRAKPRAAAKRQSPPPPEDAVAPRVASFVDASFVSLAVIVRVRGRIGEVAANILTDFPDRLTRLREVLLLDAGGRRRPARVRRCWLASSHRGQAIFHFEGVDSIDAAKPLVGCEVQVPIAERAPLPHGRFFITDLIGCEVLEVKASKDAEEVQDAPSAISSSSFTSSASFSPSFTSLGLVRDVYLESGTPLLVVATARGELLIPFADEICTRIDPAARRIEVRLPPGLRELNLRD